MEAYSTDASPRADTPAIPPPPPKVKLMYSYGGRIQPRPHDHRLTYVGGHTKIITVYRSVSYSSLLAKLLSLCDTIPGPNNLAVKYQLPGEDLDALVSIFDDDDLDHMMVEYDQLCSINPAKTARLRLFLFPLSGYNRLSSLSTSDSDDSNNSKSSNSWFVHAINYASKTKPVNPDYHFGFDKNSSEISGSEKNPDPNPNLNLHISGEICPPMFREKPTASQEISAALSVPANFPAVQVPVSGGGGYEVANSAAGNNAAVYYIPAAAGGYVAAGFQPMMAHGGQGFYGVQQIMQANVGYDAAGRQVFYAVAVEGRHGGGGGEVGVEGNVANVAAQSQTSTA